MSQLEERFWNAFIFCSILSFLIALYNIWLGIAFFIIIMFAAVGPINFFKCFKNMFFIKEMLVAILALFIICIPFVYNFTSVMDNEAPYDAEFFYVTNIIYQNELAKIGKEQAYDKQNEIEKAAFKKPWEITKDNMWGLPISHRYCFKTKFEIIEGGKKYQANMIVRSQEQCRLILESNLPNLSAIIIDNEEISPHGWSFTPLPYEKIVDICERVDKSFTIEDKFSLVFLNQ